MFSHVKLFYDILTPVLFINKIIDMNIYTRFYMGDHFPQTWGSCPFEQEMLKQCEIYVNTVKEARHLKVLEWQKSKFDRLWQKYQGCKNNGHSKQDHSGKHMYVHPNQSWNLKLTKSQWKWVINLSSTTLTPTKEVLIANGPYFAVVS